MVMISTMVPHCWKLAWREAHKQVVSLKSRGKVDGIVALSVVALNAMESSFQRDEKYFPCLVDHGVIGTSKKTERKK